MIEKVILDYLNGSTLSCEAYMEVPEGDDTKYIVIQKTGGGEKDMISSATIAIQSYAATLYQAAQLNEEVKALMKPWLMPMPVSACKLNSDYNFTDTRKKKYRYQAIFNISYKE